MAYFAKINSNNIVETVISVNNNVLLDQNNVEQESKGIEFLKNLYNDQNSKWVQTSFNTRANKYLNPDNTLAADQSKAFRKNFASIGYTYDEQRNAFIPPKVFNSWILNENSCVWEAPIPKPPKPENGWYIWNENIQNWEIEEVV